MQNNERIPIKRILLRQGAIFLAYLIMCSLFLFNHSGGTDIAFIAFMVICVLLHFIVLFILTMVQRNSASPKKCNLEDVLALIFIAFIFGLISGYYIDFMWWLSHRLKHFY